MKLTDLTWLAAVAALTGCVDVGGTDDVDTGIDTGDTDTDTVDTDDTDVPPDVTPMWNTAWNTDWKEAITCTRGSFTLSLETSNWGFLGQAYMAQVKNYGGFDAYDEEHTLTEGTPGGLNGVDGFTPYSLALTTGATLGTYADGTTTSFKCTEDPGVGTGGLDPDDGGFQVAFAVGVWGEDDAALFLDTDPTNDPAPADCIVFGACVDTLLTDTSGNGRTPPAWLTDAITAGTCRNAGSVSPGGPCDI